MQAHPPPRSGAAKGPVKHTPIPTEWRIELPDSGATADSEFGGCRCIEEGYAREKVLGQGTYGEVYLVEDLRTKEKAAAKKIKMDNEKEGFPITAIREIKILSALANATEEIEGMQLKNNVIGLREIVRSGSHRANNYKGSIYMIFDYMDHDMTGLLERTTREGRPFTAPQVKCYMRQLFCGLALLEMREVLHRDLKNANLLVNNRGELKIADFGLARYFANSGGGGTERPMTNRVITLWYRPPELFLGADKYGTEIDMWSAGCIMFELLTGKPLFPGKDEGDQVDKIFAIVGQPTEASMPGCSKYSSYQMVAGVNRWPARGRLRQHCEARGIKDPQALSLLEQLLALNPAARIKACKAVTHDYFFTQPVACKLSEMPKFPPSHEMGMKRARQEQRHGAPRFQPNGGGGSGAPGHGGAPPAQRPRTQGQYSGPPGPGPGPYRGGGAPAAAAAAGGMRMPGVGPPMGVPGVMPGQPVILTATQVQSMGLMPPGGMMGPPGMMQQQPGGYGGGGAGGAPGRFGPSSAGVHGGMPHRYGGGAEPRWKQERR